MIVQTLNNWAQEGRYMARKWYVVYTKPRKEDLVSNLLIQASLECFAPKLKTYRFVNSHREEVLKPLFPSYIFASFSYPDEYDLVRWTWGVNRVVGTTEGPIPVPHSVVDFIRENSNKGIVEIKERPFQKGDLVQVLHGPFKGIIAVFERELRDRERSMILLDAVYNARVEIKTYYLARAAL
jgi:transcriptional antiterminator RfaH